MGNQPLLSCLPYLSTFFFPTPDDLSSKPQEVNVFGWILHTSLFPLPPPRILPFAPQKFITSKIPNIVSLLSECFFQFLTLIKTWFSLKITDHITHIILLTAVNYKPLGYSTSFLEDIASHSLSISPIQFPWIFLFLSLPNRFFLHSGPSTLQHPLPFLTSNCLSSLFS